MNVAEILLTATSSIRLKTHHYTCFIYCMFSFIKKSPYLFAGLLDSEMNNHQYENNSGKLKIKSNNGKANKKKHKNRVPVDDGTIRLEPSKRRTRGKKSCSSSSQMCHIVIHVLFSVIWLCCVKICFKVMHLLSKFSKSW